MTRIASLCLAALICVAPVGVFAQTEADLEAARATFGEGVEHIANEAWADAVAAFRQVIAVRDVPAVRYNLGFALSHTDALLEAASLLDSVVADPESPAPIIAQARDVLADLETRLGRLQVSVAGDEAGVDVEVDGEALTLDRVGMPFRALPGAHRAVLRRGAEIVAERSLEVTPGQTTSATLVAVELSPEVVTTATGGEGDQDMTAEPWFWPVVGGAAAVVVLTVTIGIVAAASGTQAPLSGNLMPGVITID